MGRPPPQILGGPSPSLPQVSAPAAKISEAGRSKSQDTPPDQGTNTEYDPLLEEQPVEYIKHVGSYVSSSRTASYEARGSADNPLEETQTHGRETNTKGGAVIKPRCDKGVDKSSSSSRSERARDDTKLTQLVVAVAA